MQLWRVLSTWCLSWWTSWNERVNISLFIPSISYLLHFVLNFFMLFPDTLYGFSLSLFYFVVALKSFFLSFFNGWKRIISPENLKEIWLKMWVRLSFSSVKYEWQRIMPECIKFNSKLGLKGWLLLLFSGHVLHFGGPTRNFWERTEVDSSYNRPNVVCSLLRSRRVHFGADWALRVNISL